jgi:hypothetical protein
MSGRTVQVHVQVEVQVQVQIYKGVVAWVKADTA